MRFTDLLRMTVLLSAGAATTLAFVTVAQATGRADATLVYASAGWWVLACLVGGALGRRAQASPPIARALAGARAQTVLPELRPGRVIVNRLWPLFVATLAGVVAALWLPQATSIASGFAIIWALAWRRQEAAVQAIEDRDGAQFFVEPTSPFAPIRLVRTPGFRTAAPAPPAAA